MNTPLASTTSQPIRPKRKATKSGNPTVKIFFDLDAKKAFRVQWIKPDGTIGRKRFASFDDANACAEKLRGNSAVGSGDYRSV